MHQSTIAQSVDEQVVGLDEQIGIVESHLQFMKQLRDHLRDQQRERAEVAAAAAVLPIAAVLPTGPGAAGLAATADDQITHIATSTLGISTGRGLFASMDLQPNQILGNYTDGPHLTEAEVGELRQAGTLTHVAYIRGRGYFDGRDLSIGMIQRSKTIRDSNAKLFESGIVRIIKSVPRGGEIFMGYGKGYVIFVAEHNNTDANRLVQQLEIQENELTSYTPLAGSDDDDPDDGDHQHDGAHGCCDAGNPTSIDGVDDGAGVGFHVSAAAPEAAVANVATTLASSHTTSPPLALTLEENENLTMEATMSASLISSDLRQLGADHYRASAGAANANEAIEGSGLDTEGAGAVIYNNAAAAHQHASSAEQHVASANQVDATLFANLPGHVVSGQMAALHQYSDCSTPLGRAPHGPSGSPSSAPLRTLGEPIASQSRTPQQMPNVEAAKATLQETKVAVDNLHAIPGQEVGTRSPGRLLVLSACAPLSCALTKDICFCQSHDATDQAPPSSQVMGSFFLERLTQDLQDSVLRTMSDVLQEVQALVNLKNLQDITIKALLKKLKAVQGYVNPDGNCCVRHAHFTLYWTALSCSHHAIRCAPSQVASALSAVGEMLVHASLIPLSKRYGNVLFDLSPDSETFGNDTRAIEKMRVICVDDYGMDSGYKGMPDWQVTPTAAPPCPTVPHHAPPVPHPSPPVLNRSGFQPLDDWWHGGRGRTGLARCIRRT